MVKSYKGAQITKEAPNKEQLIRVSDYMSTKLITFTPDQYIHEVIEVLLKHKISGAPVVDEQGNLVGIISESDCMKEVVKGKYNNMPNLTGRVMDHMTEKVETIKPDTNIFDAAGMFISKKMKRFPVVNMGKLVGQVSQKDIMRAFHRLSGQTW